MQATFLGSAAWLAAAWNGVQIVGLMDSPLRLQSLFKPASAEQTGMQPGTTIHQLLPIKAAHFTQITSLMLLRSDGYHEEDNILASLKPLLGKAFAI